MDVVQLDSGSVTRCTHAFCHECISEHIHRDEALQVRPPLPYHPVLTRALPHHPPCHPVLTRALSSSKFQDNGRARCPICRANLTFKELFRLKRLLPPPPGEADQDGASGGGAGGSSSSSVGAGGSSSSGGGGGDGSSSSGVGEGEDQVAAPVPVASTKSRLVSRAVHEMLAADPNGKCLVFSSYTKYGRYVPPAARTAPVPTGSSHGLHELLAERAFVLTWVP